MGSFESAPTPGKAPGPKPTKPDPGSPLGSPALGTHTLPQVPRAPTPAPRAAPPGSLGSSLLGGLRGPTAAAPWTGAERREQETRLATLNQRRLEQGRSPYPTDGGPAPRNLLEPVAPAPAPAKREPEIIGRGRDRLRSPLASAPATEPPVAPAPERDQPAIRLRQPAEPMPADDESFSGNRRLVDHMGTTREDGLLPKLFADALTTQGKRAEAEFRDFADQLSARDPKRAQSLLAKIRDQLPEATRDRLFVPGGASPGRDGGIKAGGGDPNAFRSAVSLPPGALPATAKPAPGVRVAGNATVATDAAPGGYEPPIPPNKTEWFRGREHELRKFHEATESVPASEAERRVFMEVFAQEGGMAKDRAGSAASGITQGTLNDLIERGYVKGIPLGTEPNDLSAEQRAGFYKGYFDSTLKSVGGSKAFGQIGDDLAARALGDTLYRHGGKGGARIIQKAANSVTPDSLEIDGRMGSRTFNTYRTLVTNPKTRGRFLGALADERWKDAQGSDHYGPGDKVRADRFRP